MKKVFRKIKENKSITFSVVIPLIVIGIFFFFITLDNVYTQTYEIERFNRAKETIRSPITIENEAETERKMRETVLAVSDRYTTVEEITNDQITYVEEIFAAIDKVLNNGNDTETEGEDETKQEQEPLTTESAIFHLREILSTEITNKIDDVLLIKLLHLNEENREAGKQLFMNNLQTILERGVRFENIQSARQEMTTIIKYSSLNEDVKEILYDLVEFAVVENAIFDVEKTMDARKDAASNVQPVVIRSGDIIVREGQIITNEIYEELKLVGLLNDERKIFPGLGISFFIIILLWIIGYEFLRLHRKNKLTRKKVWAIMLITVLVVSMMKVISLFADQLNNFYLLVPIATGVLLIKLLIFERMSIIFAIVFSLIGSIIFNDSIPGSFNMEAGIYFLFFQFAAIISLTNIKDRVALLKTALITALINVLTIVIFTFISIEVYELFHFLKQISFGVGAAFLAAVLAIGLLPFFETTLGILSDAKLLSLANPNHPLLRKILTEAPGTYHHSVMVANLSDSACEAIGANGLLARVAAYYHDIGKTLKPHYFIENQLAIRNPHDFIEPKQSAKIIIDHVTSGVEMQKSQNFPKEIIDITAQHHGTSLVAYFYHLEKEKNPEVNEQEFRYPGPIPQTKEAAIVSICDATEAAVRSLKEPSPEKIDSIVRNIMQKKLLDGQFNDAPLTISELTIIRDTICESLKGIFHSRIQYPSDNKEENDAN